MLDEAGFPEVRILASNELDEYIIRSLREGGGMVDIYGVGTRLATCHGEGGGALGGVYKLVSYNGTPRLKVTSDISKSTIPDRKRLLRAVNSEGMFLMDVMCREEESPCPGDVVYDPANPCRNKPVPARSSLVDIRSMVMDGGEQIAPSPSLDAMADLCREQIQRLPEGVVRLENPHIYKVSMSQGLHELRSRLIDEVQRGYA